MNIPKLKQLKKHLFNLSSDKNDDVGFYQVSFLEPSEHICRFIDWYQKIYPACSLDEIDALKNFIFSTSRWYEKKFNDEDINKVLPFYCSLHHDCVNMYYNILRRSLEGDIALFYNQYLNKVPNKPELSTYLYISNLPMLEKEFLRKPKYKRILYLESDSKNRFKENIRVTNQGKVIVTECLIPNMEHNFTLLNGMTVKEVVSFMKENGLPLKKSNELVPAIYQYKMHTLFKKRLLQCVMYQLIENSRLEKGSVKIGARRAFLFAKEFDCDISIPLVYGIDLTDAYLKDFLHIYLKQGGNEKLLCQLKNEQSGKVELVQLHYILDSLHQKELKLKKKNIGQKK